MKIFFAILCGGSGTRLWPIGRQSNPKQFIPFAGEKSLLEMTIDRIAPLSKSQKNIHLVSTQEQEPLIKKTIGSQIGSIIKEPTPRNTGPALLLASLELSKQDPNAVIVFMHSDAFIPDEQNFRDHLSIAIEYAKAHDKIVTLGIIPRSPATGYGYIQAASTTKIKTKNLYPLKQFHEKPSLEIAQQYVTQDDMFWNPGFFIAKASLFIGEFKSFEPILYKTICKHSTENIGYENAKKISFDHAVMEKTKKAVVMPCDFQWSDVGNLNVFVKTKDDLNKKTKKGFFNINARNNISHTSKKIVTFIDVNDLCVVETEDAIVVSKRTSTEKIKELQRLLKEQNLEELL
jgi:mannose-1-phosphate guanylyltransferase/mannose-6-phosphate isomerase